MTLQLASRTCLLLDWLLKSTRFALGAAQFVQPSHADETSTLNPNRIGRFQRPAPGQWYNTSARRVEGKLNVHIVPHSHDDVGWLKTVDQYYYGLENGIQRAQVQNLISAMIKELADNPDRKFIYVEQAFFQRWWAEASAKTQQVVQQLVASGQLEFINGGWCMHDEASTTYIDMIDQTTLGHRLLVEQFGVMPKTTWQIDPFGHSAFQAVFASPVSGFNGLYFMRDDNQEYAERVAAGTTEMFWAPSPSLGLSAGTFAGVMVDTYAGTAGLNMGEKSTDDPIADDETMQDYNVGTIIDNFVADAMRRLSTVRGSDIMEYFGSDFNYENANTWFVNTDKLIHYANQDGRVNAFYSTPSAYTAAKLQSASYPLKTEDFFPYADGNNSMWTGYFTSRAALKGYVRDTSSIFTAARQLQALTGGAPDMTPNNPLFQMERTLSVAQHHDAVAGTEKQAVAYDYAMRIALGRANAQPLISAAIQKLTGASTFSFVACELANATICPSLEAGIATVVVLYNSQSQARPLAPVRLPVGLPSGVASFAVYDSNARIVTAQLTPLSAADSYLRVKYYGYNTSTPMMWLNFLAEMPAMGYSAYFIVPSATVEEAAHTHISVPRQMQMGVGLRVRDSVLTNGIVSLTFSSATGLLSSYANSANGLNVPLSQNWMYYRSSTGTPEDGQQSGAYIFRPNVSTPFSVNDGAVVSVTIITGPIVNEAQQTWNNWTAQSVRLWANSSSIDFDYTIGPINFYDGWGKEVVAQYTTNLATNATWKTDSNLRDSITRIRNYRSSFNYTVYQDVSGNYAPVNGFIWTQDVNTGVVLTVNNDRSQGGASITDGQLELMVHRRLVADDERGVAEPLNETGIDGKGLIIRGMHRVSLDTAVDAPAARRTAVADFALRPLVQIAPLAGVSPAQWIAANKASFSGLTAPLPPQVQVLTAHSWGPNQLLVRLSHNYETSDGAMAANTTVNLSTLFAGFNLTDITEMTLTANRPLADVTPVTYQVDGVGSVTNPVLPTPPQGALNSVTLAPMQIRTFRCTTMATA